MGLIKIPVNGVEKEFDFVDEAIKGGREDRLFSNFYMNITKDEKYLLKRHNPQNGGSAALTLLENEVDVLDYLLSHGFELPLVVSTSKKLFRDYAGILLRQPEGESLDKVVDLNLDIYPTVVTGNRVLPEDQALILYRGILERLKGLHELGIAHFNITPEHVVKTGEGVDFTDFSLARRIGKKLRNSYNPETDGFVATLFNDIYFDSEFFGASPIYRSTNGVVVNLVYCPAEITESTMVERHNLVDAKADIYMATNLLYLMLTGGIVMTESGLARPETAKTTQEKVKVVLRKGLAPFEERYQSVDDVLEDLQ